MAATTARMDLRLQEDEKKLMEQAAALSGMTLSAYARHVILRESREAVIRSAKAETVMVSREESVRLLEALGKPFTPNDRLRKALQRAEAMS